MKQKMKIWKERRRAKNDEPNRVGRRREKKRSYHIVIRQCIYGKRCRKIAECFICVYVCCIRHDRDFETTINVRSCLSCFWRVLFHSVYVLFGMRASTFFFSLSFSLFIFKWWIMFVCLVGRRRWRRFSFFSSFIRSNHFACVSVLCDLNKQQRARKKNPIVAGTGALSPIPHNPHTHTLTTHSLHF